ncbi:MAG: hypothetical protein JWQ45_288 [Blastococcus sp.]|jgi:hypothetical protein|nr:hypothetical protein [Blastococcus sp.]
MELDDVVPEPQYVTRQARTIPAPPSVVWEELHRLRMTALPVSLLLSAARFLPVLLAGKGRGMSANRPFVELVPIPVLSSEPPSSVVFGGVLQAWRVAGGDQPPALDADGVRAWAEPGWVKVGMDFRLTPGDGGTTLSSETRVRAMDAATRRRFAAYWLVVGPGSTAIRWELLTAVEVRAGARTRDRPAA